MDWLDRDNNIVLEEESGSFSPTNAINMENMFLQKQSSINDFEFKMEDFLQHNKSEDLDSKFPYNFMENEVGHCLNVSNLNKSKQIFLISKSEKKLKEKEQRKIITRDALDIHPFLKFDKCTRGEQLNLDSQFKYKNNSSVGSLDDGSDFMTSTKNEADHNIERSSPITKESTESNKKRKKNSKGTYSDVSDIDGDSLMNNNSYLDELEEKKLIYNLYNNTNTSNKDKDYCLNKIYNSGNFPCSGSSCPFYIPVQSLPLSERMKIKKEKAKLLLEKKRENSSSLLFLPKLFSSQSACQKESNLNTSASTNQINFSENNKNLNEEYINDLNSSHLSKKEIKMLRNRISAQRSRDRKKKEMDDLKLISQDLLNETYFLRKQLENKDKELKEMKEKLNKICNNCKNYVTNEKNPIGQIGATIRKDEIKGPAKTYNLIDSSTQRISTNMKYSLMAGFMVVVCLIGTLAVISSKDNVYKDSSRPGRVLLSQPVIQNENINGVMLYKGEQSSNYPFSITKDLDKFIKKQTKYFDQEDEYSYLKRKRMNFLSKMQSKQRNMVYSEEEGFLKHKRREEKENMENMCYNIEDKIQMSIKLEDNLVEEENSGLILKDELPSLDYKGVVPINYRENSLLKENIKSMYCKDFLTTAEENGKLFKNLFDKMNEEDRLKIGSR
jgi:hypothetical protein